MSPIPPPPASTATRSAISNSIQPFFYETPEHTSDVKNRRTYRGGVIHVKSGPTDSSPKHYWMNDLIHVETAAKAFLTFGYNYYSFTAYSSREAWEAAYPSAPISIQPHHVLPHNNKGGTPPTISPVILPQTILLHLRHHPILLLFYSINFYKK